MHGGPLLDGLGEVGRDDGGVRRPLPDGDGRPGPGVPGVGVAHLGGPGGRGEVAPRVHAGVRGDDAGGAGVGQPGDRRAGGEDVRVGGEHHVGHGGPGRQPRGVHPRRVAPHVRLHPVGHLLDRQRLSGAPPDVTRLEPVEAAVQVVGRLLLRQHQREPPLVGPLRPPGLVVEPARRLRTPVHRHHQRPPRGQPVRHVPEHPQIPRIAPEPGHLGQRGGPRGRGDRLGPGHPEQSDHQRPGSSPRQHPPQTAGTTPHPLPPHPCAHERHPHHNSLGSPPRPGSGGVLARDGRARQRAGGTGRHPMDEGGLWGPGPFTGEHLQARQIQPGQPNPSPAGV